MFSLFLLFLFSDLEQFYYFPQLFFLTFLKGFIHFLGLFVFSWLSLRDLFSLFVYTFWNFTRDLNHFLFKELYHLDFKAFLLCLAILQYVGPNMLR